MSPLILKNQAPAPETNPPAIVAGLGERRFVLLLCVLAAVRVCIFSAAFPFFNNVDEPAHFDLVLRYSRGDVPRKFEPLSVETAQYMARFGTPEYLVPPEHFAGGKFPPPDWTQPDEKVAARERAAAGNYHTITNPESSQPPLYYALAGLWLRLGEWFFSPGGALLYWIRFLNALLAAALVWLGFVAARMIFPDRPFVRCGVPVLLAFFPQDTFYAIQNDVLSPLCFGMAFAGLVQLQRASPPKPSGAAMTGLALAATCLVKVSNLPLLAVVFIVVFRQMMHLAKTGRLRAVLPAMLAFALSVAVPVGAWLAWCKINFGDLTGSAGKIAALGWSRKPFGEWCPHPLFTPSGMWTFWSDLLATFWRGELNWFGRPLAVPLVDLFYTGSSTMLIILAAAGLRRRSVAANEAQRTALWLGFWCCVASVAFLAVLSLAFDFGNCIYPSRARPFITSGRLLGGALIPFLLLYVYGLDRALARIQGNWPRWLLLSAIVALMTISEIAVNAPVFSSQYNWFHL